MATEAGISSVQLILQRVIYAGGNIVWTYFDHLNCKKKKKTLNCKQTICCAKQSVQWFPSIPVGIFQMESDKHELLSCQDKKT